VDNRQKRFIKSTSRDSAKKLIDEARSAWLSGKKERALRYVKMAWEIIKKHRLRLPPDYKNSFCKKCLTLWIPEETLQIYFDKKHDCIRIRCKKCGHTKRI